MFRWVKRTLQLPSHAEEQIAEREPGSHGLTVLPYFAGERSPHWRPDLRAAIAGMSLASKPSDILQACLESVAISFKQIYALLTRPFQEPAQVIASGGALLRSKVWLQMMADALGRPVVVSQAAEASSRGAAIIAAEQMGFIGDLDAASPRLGATVNPKPERVSAYQHMLLRDERLFEALYGKNSAFDPPEYSPSFGKTAAPFSSA